MKVIVSTPRWHGHMLDSVSNSLVKISCNHVLTRFLVFTLSFLTLIILVVHVVVTVLLERG